MMKALRIKKKIFTFDKIYKQTISLCFIRAVFLQIFTIILNFSCERTFSKKTLFTELKPRFVCYTKWHMSQIKNTNEMQNKEFNDKLIKSLSELKAYSLHFTSNASERTTFFKKPY